jgi:hypothetical protein
MERAKRNLARALTERAKALREQNVTIDIAGSLPLNVRFVPQLRTSTEAGCERSDGKRDLDDMRQNDARQNRMRDGISHQRPTLEHEVAGQKSARPERA